jgi:hypothetical protein
MSFSPMTGVGTNLGTGRVCLTAERDEPISVLCLLDPISATVASTA